MTSPSDSGPRRDMLDVEQEFGAENAARYRELGEEALRIYDEMEASKGDIEAVTRLYMRYTACRFGMRMELDRMRGERRYGKDAFVIPVRSK